MNLTVLPKKNINMLKKRSINMVKKKTINIENLKLLPNDIVSKILLYLQCPVGRLIKDEMAIYEDDHNWVYTRIYKLYYVKSIMSFPLYCFDKLRDPTGYDSYHTEYDSS